MANEQAQLGMPYGVGVMSSGKKMLGSTAIGDGLDATTFAALKDINALRAALTASNGTYYTATRMNGMNLNDLRFCWLVIQGYKP